MNGLLTRAFSALYVVAPVFSFEKLGELSPSCESFCWPITEDWPSASFLELKPPSLLSSCAL